MTSQSTLKLLRAYESRNITFIDPSGRWPIVWERARGVNVRDADGRKYLDLTAAFGVANAGHANPRVIRAARNQASRLLHAMGDVHPHAPKAELARELSRITFERWVRGRAKTIFCNSGFEAVEAALKTALLATGKPGVIAFEGAYHGTGYGALNATHREHFRGAFRNQLREFATFVPFPVDEQQARKSLAVIRRLLHRQKAGAILAEPIQGRAGIRVPPSRFLPLLRRLCTEHGALLILDEIYTGFGRTGRWFACEHSRVVPDLICLGKALTGGFPLSACVGRARLMDSAWPISDGEAIHTSTFLGHPVGCAMALAQIAEIRRLRLPQRTARLGGVFLRHLNETAKAVITKVANLRCAARGVGLMAGVEVTHADGSPASGVALAAIKTMLHRGFILLPEGEHSNVISFTPPLTITEPQLRRALRALERVLVAL